MPARATTPGGYLGRMTRRTATYSLATAFACDAAVASATDAGVATGVLRVGPGLLLVGLAIVLLVTLVLKPIAGILLRRLAQRHGARRIRQTLERHSSHVLSDVIVPGVYGGLTRIDHLIMTSGGVVCVLTKHYSGTVLGGAEEPQWVHVQGTRRRHFLNPKIQNQGRVAALRKIVPGLPVANVVVFTGNVDLSGVSCSNAIAVAKLNTLLKQCRFEGSPITDWDAAWMTLQSAVLTDEASQRDFAAQLSFG